MPFWGEQMSVVKKGLFHKALRPIFNLIGALKGYSGCLICGDTWDWKKPHFIEYQYDRGAFPTCEECWQTRTDEEIIGAAIDLASKWRMQGPNDAASALVLAATEQVIRRTAD